MNAFPNTRAIEASEEALEELALDGFPTIDDFAVVLVDSEEGGKHVEYRSARYGRLAEFPAWDHADRDLRHFTPYDVPLGSADEPFDERDDAWRILIFESGGHVYVLEGASPKTDVFPTYFRVPVGRYMQAWAALIDVYNPITPLDEKSDEEVSH
jgi:hypothetical protein